ncbi:hypothetical protein ARMSODRAFT_184348 [Armillaria solidipes]|uniref:Uncharacterized protein n=1 Tax=Armillaria solidipes TaxID=1076256 RepID=A0A2H3BVP7_9AGAR|nr:hypothetical protein ARMSODRAFT_184348 [Armillaria solidipes]
MLTHGSCPFAYRVLRRFFAHRSFPIKCRVFAVRRPGNCARPPHCLGYGIRVTSRRSPSSAGHTGTQTVKDHLPKSQLCWNPYPYHGPKLYFRYGLRRLFAALAARHLIVSLFHWRFSTWDGCSGMLQTRWSPPVLRSESLRTCAPKARAHSADIDNGILHRGRTCFSWALRQAFSIDWVQSRMGPARLSGVSITPEQCGFFNVLGMVHESCPMRAGRTALGDEVVVVYPLHS